MPKPLARTLRAFALVPLTCVIAVGAVHAQQEMPRPDEVLALHATPDQPVAQTGASTLGLELRFREGWHAYAPNDKDFYPLSVRARGNDELEVLGVEIAPPPKRESVLGETIGVWGGTLTAKIRIRPRAALKTGTRGTLPVEVSYQACDDTYVNCLFPHTVKTTLSYVVAPGAGEPTKQTDAAASTATAEERGEATNAAPHEPGAKSTGNIEATTGAASTSNGFLLEMLLALLAGLGVTLTPCVYPLIPVTITYFQNQAGSRTRALPLALAYGLGIVIMYTALGLVMARLGRDLGSILGNPWVMWAFVAMFFTLALSMFGYFELALPSSFTTRLQASGQRGGLLGAFILGSSLGLVAAPCVGPVAGGLMLVVATRGDLLFGLATFGAFGIGLASPFVLLGIFSTRLSALPRAGAWMNGVKHVFGWVLLAFCIYFANVALGSERALLALVGLYTYFLGIDAWLAGRTRVQEAPDGTALGKLLFGGGLLATLFGGYLLVGPYLLPEKDGALINPKALFASEVTWHQGEHGALLAEARRQGKPVVIDFTARWCIPCQQMELTTFRDPRVIRELKRFYPIRVDVTNDETAQRLKIERYRSYTVPYFAFYDSKGRLLPEKAIAGKTDTETFLQRLKEID